MSVRTTVKSIQDIMRQDTGVDGDAQRISQLCWMFFLKIIDDQDQELEMLKSSYRSPIPLKFQWRAWAANPEGITGEDLNDFVNEELFPGLKGLPVSGAPGDRRRVVRDVFEDAYNYMKSGQLMRQVVNKINEVDFNNLAERQHFGDIYEQILNDLQSAGNAGEYYTPRAVTAFMVDRIDPKPGETMFDPACGTGGFLTCALRHMRDRYVKRPEDEERMQGALRAVEKKQLPHMLCVTNMLLHGIEDPSFVRHDNTLARSYISYTQSDRVDIVLTNPPFGGREEDGIESNFPQNFRTRETADLFLALIVRLLKPGGRAAVVLPDGTLYGEGVKTRLKEYLLDECNLHTVVRLPNSVFKPYASVGTNLLFFEKGSSTKEVWFYEHRVPAGQKAYSMTKPIRFEHLQGCTEWWGGADRKGRKETEVAWKVNINDIKARGYNLDIKNPHTAESNHGHSAEWLEKVENSERVYTSLRDQLQEMLTKSLPPTAIRLLDRLNKMVQTQDSIAPLRRFILDVAVRGRLVPQDTNDKPARELLKQTDSERMRLIQSGKIRKRDLLPALKASEVPFSIPSSWMWLRLGDLGVTQTGTTPPKSKLEYFGDYLPFIKPGDISAGAVDYSNEGLSKIGSVASGRIAPSGSILMVCIGTIGKSQVINRDCSFNQQINSLSPYTSFDHLYLYIAVKSSFFQEAAWTSSARTTIAILNKGNWELLPVPIPPLAEQRRIVAKVNQLLELCDHIEVCLKTREDLRAGLLNASLGEALQLAAVCDEAA